jgi:hypothetical protein
MAGNEKAVSWHLISNIEVHNIANKQIKDENLLSLASSGDL